VNDALSRALYPHEAVMRMVFAKISGCVAPCVPAYAASGADAAAMRRADRNHFFKQPVSRQSVPDYFDVIEKPMCWQWIEERLERHEYWHAADFKVNSPARTVITGQRLMGACV
jgi:hypothetical protein